MASSSYHRSSNVELLRILAMFLVLVHHANILSIGIPSGTECVSAPGNTFFRFFIQSLAIVAVDVFVLISGWFGIKPSLKKLLALLFQVFFFTLTIPLVFCLIKGFGVLTPRAILKSLMITKCYWFVKSYVCLFILSPVLNMFAEKAPKRTFSIVLILFFAFQTIYGWTDSAPEFNYGSSVVSFCGLYLLARYLRLYPFRFQTNRGLCVSAYLGLSLVLAAGIWVATRLNFHPEYAVKIAFSYINPLTALSAIALLLTFVNTDVPYSKTINWFAASAFSVYIIHINGFIFHYFQDAVWYFYSNFPVALRSLLIICFLVLVFMACVFLDKIRILVWRWLEVKLLKDDKGVS